MPIYKYTAINADGATIKGEKQADSPADLEELLRESSLSLLTFKEKEEKEKRYGKLPLSFVSEYCTQLSVMVGTGVPLIRSLQIISEDDTLKPRERESCSELINSICEGDQLSTAMEKQGSSYPPLLINMVRSAEGGSDLARTLEKMGEYYGSQNRMNQKISSALMYPRMIAILLVAAVVGIMAFIVPEFESIFDMLESLPAPTAFLLGVSDFIVRDWQILLAGGAALVIGARIIFRIPAVMVVMDTVKLKLPIFGKMLRVIYTARFASSLNSLYSSGTVITTALQLSRKNIGNAYIEKQFDEAIELLYRGEPLSVALSGIDGFESKLISIIKVGEESGRLGEMLESMSSRYEYETGLTVDKMVKMIEPMMIVIMAGIIGFIMISVMMPIIGTYDALEQSANY